MREIALDSNFMSQKSLFLVTSVGTFFFLAGPDMHVKVRMKGENPIAIRLLKSRLVMGNLQCNCTYIIRI